MHRNVVLFIIVIAQFLCTSLWFASNGVMNDLITSFALSQTALGHLTTSLQLGFICGTLAFAIYRVVDRVSPSKVFLYCAVGGAIANALLILPSNDMLTLLSFRFLTGFFLAGVYPVGMKIAADYFDQGLGRALGFLVGALVIGTALPHLIRAIAVELHWGYVLISISLLAVLGGILIGFVKDGPFRRAGHGLDVAVMIRVFNLRAFRRPAFGYFGHMWEVYTFWAFVPLILAYYAQMHTQFTFNLSSWSFVVIAAGGIACVWNGYLSQQIGTSKAAVFPLIVSGLCCAISPFMFQQDSVIIFFGYMIIWGMTVVADSPMFSTLVAQEAPAEARGTAITIVVCIGFALTIVSIQFLNWLMTFVEMKYLFLCIIPGPVLGILSMFGKTTRLEQS